jgi:hypothetical protein
MPYGQEPGKRDFELIGAGSEPGLRRTVLDRLVRSKVAFALIANDGRRSLKQGRLPEQSALARRTTVERSCIP